LLKIHKRQNRSKNIKIDSKIVKIVVQIVILIKFLHFFSNKKLLGGKVIRIISYSSPSWLEKFKIKIEISVIFGP